MDVKALYAVVGIAEHGSFAAAAARLGVSLSAVSLQVSALERRLDKQLFDRSTRPPALTAAGRSFVERARRLLAQWEALQADAAADALSGVFKIGAVHTQVRYAVPAALKALRRLAPALSVRLSTGLTDALVDQLGRGLLDCAVITVPDYLPPELSCFPLASEPLVVIADHDAAGRSTRALLEQNPYVQFNPQAQLARIVSGYLRERKIRPRVQMQIDTLDAVISLVASGLGVSVVPFDASRAALPANVRVARFRRPQMRRRIGLAAPRDGPRGELVEALYRVMRPRR